MPQYIKPAAKSYGSIAPSAYAVYFLLFAATLFIAALSAGCKSGQSALAPGVRAPEINLEDLQGNRFSLEQFRGRWVLLNFWASWCAPCIEELPSLEILNTELNSSGISVVSVAVEDDPKMLKEVVERTRITFPVLLDLPGAVKASYGLFGLPETFLIDPYGKLAMINDPQSLMPGIKVVGPRDWSARSALAIVKQTIGK